MRPFALLAFTVSLATAPAQTFVVDAQNGPGANFTTITAAIAAVPSGATLLVRPGTYPAFILAGKAMTILGEPGTIVETGNFGTVMIAATTPSQRVVIRGLGLRNTTPGSQASLIVSSAHGPVVVDGCDATLANAPAGGLLRIGDSRGVHVRNSAFVGLHTALDVASSNVTVTDSTLRTLLPEVGVRQVFGRLELTNCFVEGGAAGLPFDPATCVASVQSPGELVLRGGTILFGQMFGGAAHGVGGDGTLIADPNTLTTLVSGGLASPALGATSVRALASCTATTGPLGTTATASMNGPNGALCVLLAGFAAARSTVPTIDRDLWLDLGSVVTMGLGSGSASGAYAVPLAPALVGVTIGWQGLAYDPSVGAQFSNPAFYAHW